MEMSECSQQIKKSVSICDIQRRELQSPADVNGENTGASG